MSDLRTAFSYYRDEAACGFSTADSSGSPRCAPLYSCPSRRTLPLAGGVAGPRQAEPGIGVPAPVRVLPNPNDRELPGAELHRRASRSALRVAARVPPEQPYHGAQSWLIWLRDSGKAESRSGFRTFFETFRISIIPFNRSGVFSRQRSCGCFPTTSRGSRQGLSAS